MAYHPNYFEGGPGHRSSCADRLQCLRNHAVGRTMFDVGCSEGYNAFGMAETFDHILAVDNVERNVRGCVELAAQHNVGNITWVDGDFRAHLVGDAYWDCVMYLSVHHHICGQISIEQASKVLRELSERGEMMLFDMGQKNEEGVTENTWWKALPSVDGDQEEWLRTYVLENTRYERAELIGSFPIHNIQRLLWKLEM